MSFIRVFINMFIFLSLSCAKENDSKTLQSAQNEIRCESLFSEFSQDSFSICSGTVAYNWNGEIYQKGILSFSGSDLTFFSDSDPENSINISLTNNDFFISNIQNFGRPNEGKYSTGTDYDFVAYGGKRKIIAFNLNTGYVLFNPIFDLSNSLQAVHLDNINPQ